MIPWLFRPAVLTTGRSRLFSGLAPLVSSLKSLTLASRRPAEVGLYFLIAIAIFRLVCVCVAYPNRHSIFRNPRIPDQFQIGLKEVNLILWMQSNDCLLPVFCAAEPELVPTRLSFSDLRRNSGYPHFKKLLNSMGAYFNTIRLYIDIGKRFHSSMMSDSRRCLRALKRSSRSHKNRVTTKM